MSGYPLAQAMMMMIPEAWEQHTLMDDNRRAFYEYHASMMEPWDGPAAVAFTDGKWLGATLDVPVLASANLPSMVLAAACAVAIFRFRFGMVPVLLASSLAGVVHYLVLGGA